MKFPEVPLESSIIELLKVEDHPHLFGEAIEGRLQDVQMKGDLRACIAKQNATDEIELPKIEAVFKQLEACSAAEIFDNLEATLEKFRAVEKALAETPE